MKQSLKDLHLIAGFDEVHVEYFRQLPITWGRGRHIFGPLSTLTRIAAPTVLKERYKWIKFSKEVMLLAEARKPIST